ncbi:MAG: acyltransferase [Firmicutes bacterium]|jgi:peptidoglycan/LPS O-acetylase OafA/YrhL|nr:acyltransferase [Bacillota bacterium]
MTKRLERLNPSFYDISVYKNEIYGISILWIMLFHGIVILGLDYSKSFELLRPVQMLMKYGNMGVEIFLLCSGICLYFSFIKNNDIFLFLKKRLSRLFFPVLIIESGYWIYVCFIKTGGGVGQFLERITLMRFWLTKDSQIWFVSLILFCYFIYPYIHSMFFGEHKTNVVGWTRCILLITIVIFFTVLLMVNHKDIYDRIEIGLTRIPVFIIGCYWGKFVYEKKPIYNWAIVLIIALDLLTFFVLEQDVLHGIYRRYFYMIGGIGLIFTIPIVLKILNCKVINKFFSFLGKISLNLYLAHIIVIRLYQDTSLYDEKRVIHYLAILVISVVVAWVAEKIIACVKNINSMSREVSRV